MAKIITGQGFDEKTWTYEKSAFYKGITRVNRNYLILMLIIFALICVLDTRVTVPRYFNLMVSPAEITAAEIANIDAQKDFKVQPFFAIREVAEEFNHYGVSGRLAYPKDFRVRLRLTGISWESTTIPVQSDSEDIRVSYDMLKLDDKYLLIKRLNKNSDLTQVGTLCIMPDNYRENLILPNTNISPDLIYPYIFDSTGDAFVGMWPNLPFSALLLITWLVVFIYRIRKLKHVERSNAYKRLEVYTGSIEDNIKAIDKEIAESTSFSAGSITQTKSWRITNKMFSFKVEYIG